MNPNLTTGEIEVLAPRARDPQPVGARRRSSSTTRTSRRRCGSSTAYLDLRRDADAEEPAAALPGRDGGAPLPRRARLHRHRDADADQVHARGRARLPRAVARAPRPVLRAAAVAAALQAAADGRGLRPLLPDRASASATRTCAPTASPSSRRSTSRPRSSTSARSRTLMEALIRACSGTCSASSCPNPFPRMTLRRSDAPLWLATSRTCACAQAHRAHRCHEAVEFKVFRAAAELPDGRVAALRVPGGGELTRKEIDDYTRVRRDLRRQGPRLHQGQRFAKGRDGLQSPIVKFLTDAALKGDRRAHRRAATAT